MNLIHRFRPFFSFVLVLVLVLTMVAPAFADTIYVVQPGDTLYRLSVKFGVSVRSIQQANNLNGTLIYAGQSLTIPGVGAGPASPVAPTNTPAPNNPAPAPTSGTYTVQRGDTLYRIALQFKTTVAALQSANGLTSTLIYGGQVLKIPGQPGPAPTATTAPSSTSCAKWFFTPAPSDCAQIIVNTWTVVEHFEHGLMFWLQARGQTYILIDNATTAKPYLNAVDTSGRTYPPSDPSLIPPSGLFQPVLGFGKFWRGAVSGYGNVRTQLGWATDTEVGYSAFYQCNTATGEAARCYLSGPNGEIYSLSMGNTLVWDKLANTFPTVNLPTSLTGHIVAGNRVLNLADGSQGSPIALNIVNGFDWSPDSKRLAFASVQSLVGDDLEIYVMNADGTGLTQLTNNAVDDFSPSWSPDGKRLVFKSTGDQNGLFLMNADGTSQTAIPNTTSLDSFPDWSPTGQQIVYVNDLGKQGTGLAVINADGTGYKKLTSTVDMYPAWSPDGKHIAFQSNRDSDLEIYVMSADGTGQTRLTTAISDDIYPTWSPDSNWILFSSRRDDRTNLKLYIMKADGTQQTNLNLPGGETSWAN